MPQWPITSRIMSFCGVVNVWLCFTAAQLSQSAYFALQCPYTVFGLGRTPNFVDKLAVGIPRSTDSVRMNNPFRFPISQAIALKGGEMRAAGSEINVFRQAPTGDWNFFFQSPYGKMWSPKSVNKIFPLQRNNSLTTLAPAIRMLWETAEKNMAAKLRTDRSCETLW